MVTIFMQYPSAISSFAQDVISQAYLPGYEFFIILLSALVINEVILRYPRCKSRTYTRRFVRARGILFNEYITLMPPKMCSLCGLDFRKNYFWKWSDTKQ